jgi:hypothetical protein
MPCPNCEHTRPQLTSNASSCSIQCAACGLKGPRAGRLGRFRADAERRAVIAWNRLPRDLRKGRPAADFPRFPLDGLDDDRSASVEQEIVTTSARCMSELLDSTSGPYQLGGALYVILSAVHNMKAGEPAFAGLAICGDALARAGLAVYFDSQKRQLCCASRPQPEHDPALRLELAERFGVTKGQA